MGWRTEEDEVLKACIAKYGIGRYAKILSQAHLPFRSRAQLANRTKTLIGMQSLATFVGIPCDTDKVKKYNRERFGADFVKNRTGIPQAEDEKTREWEINNHKFRLTKSEREKVIVPYYRRSDHIGHLRLKISEGKQNLTQEECENLDAERKLLETRERDFEFYKTSFLKLIPELLDPYIGMELLGESDRQYLLKELNQSSCQVQLILDRFAGEISSFDPFDKTELVTTEPEKVNSTNLTLPNSRMLVRVTYKEGETVVAERINNNEFMVTSNVLGREQVDVFIRPWASMPICTVIDKHQVQKLRNMKKWDVLIADPPWDVAGKDPTRGLALPYETMTIDQIFDLG